METPLMLKDLAFFEALGEETNFLKFLSSS
jgi:hypothetical protein